MHTMPLLFIKILKIKKRKQFHLLQIWF